MEEVSFRSPKNLILSHQTPYVLISLLFVSCTQTQLHLHSSLRDGHNSLEWQPSLMSSLTHPSSFPFPSWKPFPSQPWCRRRPSRRGSALTHPAWLILSPDGEPLDDTDRGQLKGADGAKWVRYTNVINNMDFIFLKWWIWAAGVKLALNIEKVWFLYHKEHQHHTFMLSYTNSQ